MKKTKKSLTISLALLIILASAFIFRDRIVEVVKAATYIFTQGGTAQTDWTGGATANTAIHPTNQSNWKEYSAKDANAIAGTTVSISSEITALTHTTTDDFSGGAGTGVLTTGDQISLDLP